MLNECEKQSPGTTACGARSARTTIVFRPGTLAVTALLVMFLTMAQAWAQNPAAPPSLKTIPIPQPSNLDSFVKSRPAAIALGKALFWDMQVGSDAVQACATCHFNAGADIRPKNVI